MESTESADAGTPAIDYRTLPIRFSGRGSEYFRIWIVNLLLLIVTFGIYWPWAKVRRTRYFLHNTLVDGDPMDYHAEPRQMLKGWALVGVLFAMYNVAGNASPVAGLVAFVALAALWPALWRSSMRFRLGNTSWRGLRFRFTGSLAGAYVALLPLALVGLPVIALGLFLPDDPEVSPPDWLMAGYAVAMVAALAVLPWLLWRMKAYQHRNYALAHLQTDFRARVSAFYGLAFKTFLMFLAPLALLAGVVALLVWQGEELEGLKAGGAAIAVFVPILLIFLFVVGVQPWWATRVQNLVWTKTGNAQVRFISHLRFREVLWLGFKNSLFMVLTLGLYWPFAAVAVMRLRLEAVQVRCVLDPEALVAQAQERPAEAAGDAAGDFFGLDVGL